ncbi:T3SS (YopN, CesT) and YbjN peptide-binding chaperone 1 [Longispora urticae]
MLYDDVDTVDLKSKVTAAWQDFTRALARALPTLPPDVRLDLTLDPTASGTGEAIYEINVIIGADKQMAGYAVGNANLPEGYRLDRTAVGHMIELGWSPPGVVDGSEGNFGLHATAEEGPQLAALLSRTMRDVYGAPHPAFLTYTVRPLNEAIEAAPAGPATLATARPAPTLPEVETAGQDAVLSQAMEVASALPLADKVRTVVAALLKTEPDKLEVDEEGEIGVRAGSAMVFVKVHENPAVVDVYSPILTEVAPDAKLYERLAQLTRRMPIGRLYCTDKTVWASVPVFGRDFQPTHLMLAVQVMMGLADELDDRLHGEFGGKRFFGEGDVVHKPTGEERTGMYL